MSEQAIVAIDSSLDLSKVLFSIKTLRQLNIHSLILLYLPRYQRLTIDIFPYIAQMEQKRLDDLKMSLITANFKVKEYLIFDSLLTKAVRVAESTRVSTIVTFADHPKPERISLSPIVLNHRPLQLLILPLKEGDEVNDVSRHLLYLTDSSLSVRSAFSRLLLLVSSVPFHSATIMSVYDEKLVGDREVLERQKLESMANHLKSVGVHTVDTCLRCSTFSECSFTLSGSRDISFAIVPFETALHLFGGKILGKSRISVGQFTVPLLLLNGDKQV